MPKKNISDEIWERFYNEEISDEEFGKIAKMNSGTVRNYRNKINIFKKTGEFTITGQTTTFMQSFVAFMKKKVRERNKIQKEKEKEKEKEENRKIKYKIETIVWEYT